MAPDNPTCHWRVTKHQSEVNHSDRGGVTPGLDEGYIYAAHLIDMSVAEVSGSKQVKTCLNERWACVTWYISVGQTQ